MAQEFQSTLPQGERRFLGGRTAAYCKFQSTLPQGERHQLLINIFASLGFQSTLPQGERLVSVTCLGTVGIFQSTLPQGERPPHPCTSSWHRYFNPRSRKGSDGNIHHHPVIYFRFQSTLPQGERQQAIKSLVIDGFISIHAPARGATQPSPPSPFQQSRFQSTLPQGERHKG